MLLVPVLIYHSVSDRPHPLIAPFAVGEAAFRRHADLIVERGLAGLTFSQYLDAIERHEDDLLARAVVITFDDGFADVQATAVPMLRERGLPATLFATTGLLRGGTRPPVAPRLASAMLDWSQLAELADAGVEIGAHSHSHPQLDTLGRGPAREEIVRSKELLEGALGRRVDVFAYPHGYSSARVRRQVREAGYRGACGVKEAFSSPDDDPLSIARLMLRAGTPVEQLADWLDRRGAPPPPGGETARTRAWRAFRRGRALATGRPGTDAGWRALTG